MGAWFPSLSVDLAVPALLHKNRSWPTAHVSRCCETPIRPYSSIKLESAIPFVSNTERDTSGWLRKSSISVVAAAMDVQMENEAKMEVFDSENELAASLAKYTAELSTKFINDRGYFTVVLSGGSLVKSLRKLLEPPYKDSIEWPKWFVFWVDERVVPKDDDDSNFKLALDNFLSKVPIPPGNVLSINDSLSAHAVAEDYEAHLKKWVGAGVLGKSSPGEEFPSFDLMLLGMGPDGHVASLFPGHQLLQETGKWVAFVGDSPKPPPQRVTLTFPVINSSSYIALVVCGHAKAPAVSSALAHPQGRPGALLPVQMVRPQRELRWFLDQAAASLL